MEELHIEFSVQGLNPTIFYLNFIQKYGRFNSIFLPVFVQFKGYPAINYLILEAKVDPLQSPLELAKMTFLEVDNERKVLIEWIGKDRSKWYTVEKFAMSVLEDLWNKGYLIISVFPRGLFHHSKIGQTKAKMVGKGIYIEGELITEEPQSNLSLSEEVNHSDEEELASFTGPSNAPSKSNLSLTLNAVDLSAVVKRYGRPRVYTLAEVKDIVAKCKNFQQRGGTIEAFYNDVLLPSTRDNFLLDTLRSWVKDKKFKP